MDINVFRSVITAVLFAVFVCIVLWAWSGKRRTDFEAAARLPLDDDPAEELPAGSGRAGR